MKNSFQKYNIPLEKRRTKTPAIQMPLTHWPFSSVKMYVNRKLGSYLRFLYPFPNMLLLYRTYVSGICPVSETFYKILKKELKKLFTFFTIHSIIPFVDISGYGSVWLERTAGGREVAGSNPVTPIFYSRSFQHYITDNSCFLSIYTEIS